VIDGGEHTIEIAGEDPNGSLEFDPHRLEPTPPR
jgi:hypothetical protein